jgi:calcium-dependent protein kinase
MGISHSKRRRLNTDEPCLAPFTMTPLPPKCCIDRTPAGSGRYGEVFRASNYGEGGSDTVAMKVFTKQLEDGGNRVRARRATKHNTATLAAVWREVELLQAVHHPNIIRCIALHEDARAYYLVLEWCDGNDLFVYIDRVRGGLKEGCLPEDDVRTIMRALMEAVVHLHTRGIVHCDIKPENVMVHQHADTGKWTVKLVDFGLARRCVPGTTLRTVVGTPYYIAPEVIRKEYTEKADAWSLGVVMYIMLCGNPPFNGRTDAEIRNAVLHDEPTFEESVWEKVAPNTVACVEALLVRNPLERPSVVDALVHSYRDPDPDQARVPLCGTCFAVLWHVCVCGFRSVGARYFALWVGPV